jgi:hypothetical protein
VTGLLRHCICIAICVGASVVASTARCADGAPREGESKSTIRLVSAEESSSAEEPNAASNAGPKATENAPLQQPEALPELFPLEVPPQPAEQPSGEVEPRDAPPDSLEDSATHAAVGNQTITPAESQFSRLKWLGLRHSSVSGRNAGMGVPLVGTSWLNRPYYFGIDLGTTWIAVPPQADITRDIDTYGGIYAGYDWDYYWGSEFAIQRATPELINKNARDANRGDRLMLWTASMLYYPWGDTYYRPYWRCGIGEMEIDYPTDNGHRRDEGLWAFPIGIGIKYPVRRWLAARAEFADQIGVGNSGVAAQHDLTLTFALEWRFGAHPRSYWPWNPSRHIW